MPVLPSVFTGPSNDGLIEVLWETVRTTSPIGTGVNLARARDKTVQIFGTFNGASIAIEGSNDDGTTWSKCHDLTGSEIALTAASFVLVVENPKAIRPILSGGDGTTDIDVYLTAKVS